MRILILIFVLCTYIVCFTKEISMSKTDTEYSLKYTAGETYRVLRFSKSAEDSVFSFFRFSTNADPRLLSSEINYIDTLLGIAINSVNIELSSADIGYPLEYSDIMPVYIQTFLDSEEWMNHISENGKTLDYKIMHDVIYGNAIFPQLIDLFYIHGYYTAGVSSEKHGFITKEDLIEFGFTGQEIVPMPFMLYWHVEKVKKVVR